MAKGGGGGGGTGSSTTTNNIPPELSALTSKTADHIGQLQEQSPMLQDYTGSHPTQVAPLSGTQQKSVGLMNSSLDSALTPLDESPIVQAGHNYFQNSIAPGITGQATLSGLGRSTANTNALAAAEAQTALPLLQGEQARRDQMITQGMGVGDTERGVQQDIYNADATDLARRQRIAERALFDPLGSGPSVQGSTTVQSSKNSSSGGGGLTVICTELHRQGLMDDATFEADERFGNELPPEVLDGYRLWAVPVVRAMRKSKLVTAIVTPLALGWAREMRRRVTGEGKGSAIGGLLLFVGVPLCGWLGRKLDRLAWRVEGKL
jgi:hypothetical protein